MSSPGLKVTITYTAISIKVVGKPQRQEKSSMGNFVQKFPNLAMKNDSSAIKRKR